MSTFTNIVRFLAKLYQYTLNPWNLQNPDITKCIGAYLKRILTYLCWMQDFSDAIANPQKGLFGHSFLKTSWKWKNGQGGGGGGGGRPKPALYLQMFILPKRNTKEFIYRAGFIYRCLHKVSLDIFLHCNWNGISLPSNSGLLVPKRQIRKKRAVRIGNPY